MRACSGELDEVCVWFVPGRRSLRNEVSKTEFLLDSLAHESLVDVMREIIGLALAGGQGPSRTTLQELGLLASGPWPAVAQDEACPSARAFFLLRAGARYWDYADPDALARDAAEMKAYTYEEAPPQLRTGPAAGRLDAHGGSMVDSLCAAAHEVFDARATVPFHGSPVHRKIVPSLGARHGLGCRISFIDQVTGERVLAAIDFDGATRETTRGPPDAADCRHPELLVDVEFEKFQWRYRTAWVYQCIFLDLGHVLATLFLLLASRGFSFAATHAVPPDASDPLALLREPLTRIQVTAGASQF